MGCQPESYTPNRCVVETTLGCNLRCRHCGSRAGDPRPDELTTAELADLFRQAARLGCRRVTMSGGEPLTRPDWIELIAEARDAGLQVALITNGLWFDRVAARAAQEAGLLTIGLSVDGIGATHDRVRGREGHFQAMIDAMAAARATGLSFTVITTMNRLNLGELVALHDLAVEQGAFSWQVQPSFEMGNMLDNPDLPLTPRELVQVEQILAELIRRDGQRIAVCNSFGYFGPHERLMRASHNAPYFRGCAAGIRTMGIESNGNVKGCLSIMAGCSRPADKADYIEGNVREEPLAAIWHRPGAFAYNRDWKIDDLGGFCRSCEHAEKCHGGCRTNMIESGNGRENPICVYRALAEQQQWVAPRRAGRAAAVLLASLLGGAGAVAACDDRTAGRGGGSDGDSDLDIDTDVDGYDTDIDGDGDGDVDTDVDGYDTDVDTDIDAGEDAGDDDSGIDADADSGD